MQRAITNFMIFFRMFPRPPRAGEQIGVAAAAVAHRVAQARYHVLLADQIRETTRPVASIQRLMGHRPMVVAEPTAAGP